MVKHLPASAGDAGSIPGSGRSQRKVMAARSSILAWEAPWTDKAGRSMGPQIPSPLPAVCVIIVLLLRCTEEGDVKGMGGNQPQIGPRSSCSPCAGNLGSSCKQLNGSPTKNTGKVTQKQRETAVPHHGAREHISRGETRGEARVSPNKSSSSNSSPGRYLQKIPSTCRPQPSSLL